MDSPLSLKIRAKKLGVLIKAARIKAKKEPLECAEAMGVSDAVYLGYEAGDAGPSLPELEMLAYFLQVPLDHFWGSDIHSPENSPPERVDAKILTRLRHRMVGALLRKIRMDAGLDLAGLSAKTGIRAEVLQTYELGEKPVPVPELDILASALGYPVKHFQDQRGPVGAWIMQQRALQEFKDLPPELQSFVCKPVNRPYLELAQRLSEMSVEKLRAVAEGLLEITL